jgi:tetratricopeptide (TPR) repeat protein
LGDQRLRHLPDVEAALNVSYEMLLPEQQQWWSALGVFPASFDDAAAGAVWQMPADAARDALAGLMRWSLVEFDEDAVRYRLHDLARLFAAERLRDGSARQRFARHYCSVLGSCNSLYFEGGESVRHGLELFDREWASIWAGQSWSAASLESDPVAAELCVEYPNAGAYVLELRLHPRERIGWHETRLAAARRLKRRNDEGNALGNLGIAWDDLGEPRKAIEFYEQHLAIARVIGDRRGEGAALGNLGIAWKNLGEPRKAIEFYEQALVIDREIGNRRDEGADLANLGLAWYELGEPRKAIEFHEQALVIQRAIGNRRGEGAVLGNLGLAWANLGETRKAIEFYEQDLVVAREIGDRRGEGAVLGNLGLAWADLGEPRKAIEFHEQALVIDREIGDRRGEGNALWGLSLSLDMLGERAQAIALAEASLAIYEAIEDAWTDKVRQQLADWRGQ